MRVMNEDTRNCKFCGIEFSKVRSDEGTFNDGYCGKFCRKDHEKQQIKEGSLESVEEFKKKLNIQGTCLVDNTVRDVHGEPIWMPKVGGYHDPALGVYFESKKQKQAYMKEKGISMEGSWEKQSLPIEAGDYRQRSNRLN